MQGKYIAIGTLVLAIIGLAYFSFSQTEAQPESAITQPSPTVTVETTNAMTDSAEYQDGEYSAEGEYTTPAGMEKVGVTVTLEGGVVTDVQLDQLAKDPTSKRLQAKFGDAYTQEVIGKSIDEIDLDVVGGSSLTPNGFEDALQKIKSQAAA